MSGRIMVEQSAPTLAGIKTASLFWHKYEQKNKFLSEIRVFNQRMRAKGVRLIPVKQVNKKMLVYLYRPNKLREDLSDGLAEELLKQFGYESTKPNQCIAELIRRLNVQTDFPHEIGLFLGFPPEDVLGFITHRDEGCKCIGYWKVYGDECQARCRFCNYRKCTQNFKEQYLKGVTVEQLTVAV